MESILKRLDIQDRVLDDISKCLKGSENLGLEGVMPAQRRMTYDMKENQKEVRREIKEMRDQLSIEIKEVKQWKDTIMTAVGWATNKKVWTGILVFSVIMASIVTIVRLGWEGFFNWAGNIIKILK